MDRLLSLSFYLSISWCGDTHSIIRRATQEVLSVFSSSSSKTAVSAAMWSIACDKLQVNRSTSFEIMGFHTNFCIFLNELFYIFYIKWAVIYIFGSHCFNFPENATALCMVSARHKGIVHYNFVVLFSEIIKL
jgi:hypothetical protein